MGGGKPTPPKGVVFCQVISEKKIKAETSAMGVEGKNPR